ncbi:MAG: sugar phosphate isomerase/epimerase [Methylobacteriaceae bacterium]|nr:sugar phosphate isomerase/epimerase [Methylobacteriaceae bacterium]MBV9705173.1 sugar phosphate isomerase/epimerase [Methylobacteriaceae bacterium]
MQLGVFAKTFEVVGARSVLQAVADAGFACTQFNMACVGLAAMPDTVDQPTRASITEASRATGIDIIALSGTYNMIHPDPAVRRQGLARLDVLGSVCASIGTRLLTLCTGTRDPDDQWRKHPDNGTAEAWRDLLAEFEPALAIAEKHDIHLGVEPELANVVSSAQRARQLIDELQSDRVRIILDPANLVEAASDGDRRAIVDRAVGLLADRIAMAHAKDRNADGTFATAGKGVIDFRHFVDLLRGAGFDGPLVAHGLAAAEASDVAGFLGEVLGRTARQEPAA